MHVFLSLLTAISWTTLVWSLQESQAGVVDWHKTFIGVPQSINVESSSVFHRVQERNSSKSVVLIATENTNVLAALDPVNGSIVWRFIFEQTDQLLTFYKHGSVVAALSGVGGSSLRLFDSLEGDLILEKQLHGDRPGHLLQPNQLGASIAFLGDASWDMFVLTDGHTIYRIDGSTGEMLWTWAAPDESSLIIYEKLVVSGATLYAVGLTKSFASYSLHVTALSSTTGELLASVDLPSSIGNGRQDFMLLSRDSEQTPCLLWLEAGSAKYVVLTPKLAKQAKAVPGTGYEQIINLGLDDKGLFVLRRKDGSSYVFGVEGGTIQQAWEFADSARSERLTDSLYTGGTDKDGNPYVGRLYWSHAYQAASLHVYVPHLRQGQGIVSGFTFPFDTNDHGIINHFALDVVNPEGLQVLTRAVLTTSTGSVQLWYDNKLQWTREEGLSAVLAAEFVELPEKKTISSHTSAEGETFVQRLFRHISDAQNFPQYLIAFVKRFATGSYASTSSSVSVESSDLLFRDEFGFRQIIVAVTGYGKVYGLDSSNGQIVWSRILSLGQMAKIGGSIVPLKMFLTRSVTDDDTPQLVLVSKRQSLDGIIDTVVFHFDPTTGEDVLGLSASTGVLQGVDVLRGPPLEAYMLESEAKIVAILDDSRQVHLYPNTLQNRELFGRVASSYSFPSRTSGHEIQGFRILSTPDKEGVFASYPTWSIPLPQTELVHSITRGKKGPIASLGKVLGNRTTLYKYLNPHLFVVTTAPRSPNLGTCSIYLVDGIKGTIVYHVTLTTKGACAIEAVLSENWLVYSYYDDEYVGIGQSKGHRVISVELYEGSSVDHKTRSLDMSSFSNGALDVHVLEKAYDFTLGMKTITTTSTKFGITTKDIIVATKSNQIQFIPRRFLDPRRPKDKPTAEEQEEMLLQYDPIIPADPRLFLSHKYDVAGTRQIITSPALLESTSLVFAFGIDLFFTRTTPSSTFDVLSEDFNKLQLVLTVAGLAVAIMITKPMVYRKQLRERWYS